MNQSRSGRWNIYRALLNPFSSVPQVQTISTLTGVAGIDEATLRGDDVLPAVSPDGKALAFFSNRHGRWQIWVMPLTEQPPAAERPASNPTPDTELDEEDVEELPLGAIALVDLAEAFPDWSQHALQWTK
jgi:Tol biopolymer transport system component